MRLLVRRPGQAHDLGHLFGRDGRLAPRPGRIAEEPLHPGLGKTPPFNRRYLELRVGYRIQELAHGGLRRVLGLPADEVEGGARSKKRIADPRKPAPGTGLVRKWGGEEHTVTVAGGRLRMVR